MANETFGEFLKRVRAEKSARDGRLIGRNEVCETVGIGESTLGQLESGARDNPGADLLLRLCEYYRIPVEDAARALSPGVRVYPAPGGSATTQLVPVVGTFADGKPIQQESGSLVEVPGRWGEVNALIVRGDVPAARLCDGDILVVRKRTDPELGDIVLCERDGVALVAKVDKVEPQKKTKKITSFVPFDGSKPMPVSAKDLIGVIASLYRQYQ